MYAKQGLHLGTGKLHVKNHIEKWVGLEGEPLTFFFVVVVVVFFYVIFYSYFLSFYRNSCREVFWKKDVLNILDINTCREFIFGKVAGFQPVTLR